MKILLPNAKELNTNMDSLPFSPLASSSQEVLREMVGYSPEELATFYGLSLEKAQLEWDCWQRIDQTQSRSYPAWLLYDGLMYRYMKRKDISAQETAYLQEHALIATGLYGLISVFEPISPHRLDFQGKMKIGEQSLKAFWRTQYDELVSQDSLLISFLSSEFEAVFSPAIQARLLKVVFMEESEGNLKVHSTISKKGRGRFLSAMAETSVRTVAELKEIEAEGFAYRKDLSTEKKLVFVRKKD